MSPDDNQEELALFRENIRRFAAEYIAPHYQQWEKDGLVTRQLWNQLGEAGLLCVEMPEQYGGCDVDTRFAHAIYEEFSYLGYTGIYAGTCVHSASSPITSITAVPRINEKSTWPIWQRDGKSVRSP